MIVAGLLDVAENLGMEKMLDGSFDCALAVSICAATKFLLTGLALLYVLGSHVARPR